MRFETPWALLALLAIPLALYLRARANRAGTGLRFPSLANVLGAGRSHRQRLTFLPTALRVLALALLIVALARPQQGKELVRDLSKGVAIEMVVDRSGSMGAEMSYGRKTMTRLETVKRVFEEFVTGNKKDLPGRPNDLVGMIAFARYPDTICPLTLAHGALERFLENLRLVQRQSEDGTAIGDALALAAARLKTAEADLARQMKEPETKYEIKSKVIILLTDGQNNCGKRGPREAAELAAKWGVKIHAIGIGGQESVTTIHTPLGDYKVPGGPGVDEGMLKAIAQATGGICRLAEDEESLRAVYAEIDKLEKSEIEAVRYLDYRELFSPFALAALGLLALAVALGSTLVRKIP